MYDVVWNKDAKPAKVPADDYCTQLDSTLPLAVGTTPLDALTTYASAHSCMKDTGDEDPTRRQLEQWLTKLETLLLARDDGVETQQITGEAYFAMTPQVCMGDGRLHAALSAGPLSAWFDAFVDFLINYKPFHFKAVGGIAVGVRFSMDLWLVTVRISAEISATLSVMGPSSVSSFPEVAAWHDSLQAGTWIVRGAAFSCTVSLGFAATEASLVDAQLPPGTRPKDVEIADAQKQVFARPMQLRDPLTSTVTATITKTPRASLGPQGNERTDTEWGIEPVLKTVPQSIWGQYSPSDDPAVSGNGVSALLDGRQKGSISAVMGFTPMPPLPSKSKDTLPKFNMQQDLRQSVNKNGFPFDATVEADEAWDSRPLTKEEEDNRDLRWDHAVEEWKSDGVIKEGRARSGGLTRSEKVFRAWAARLQFDEGALTGEKPAALIVRFNEMVPGAPAIAVGS